MAFVVVRASQQVILTLFLTALEPPRRYTSGQRASSALASVPGRTWNRRPCGSSGTYISVECKSAQAGGLNAWPLGRTEVLAFGHTAHGSQISEVAACPATDDANPGQGRKEVRARDRTLHWDLPGSDLGCSAPIHLHPREHRNHARTGIMFRRRPRRRAACPSTQAPRQHRCGSLACRRRRYPHSHPTQAPNVAPQLPASPTVRGRMPQRKINMLHVNVNVCMPECPCCATTRGGTCRGYQSMLGSGGLSARGTLLSPVCVGVVDQLSIQSSAFRSPVLQS